MVAAPFVAVLKFQTASGRPFSYRCTVSDVAAAFYIFPDGDSKVRLPSDEPSYLVDMILSLAGTDTTNADIFANGKTTGEQVQNAANLATNVSRQFMGAPIGFKPGAEVRFTQRA